MTQLFVMLIGLKCNRRTQNHHQKEKKERERERRGIHGSGNSLGGCGGGG
jgi:hypothetical protein